MEMSPISRLSPELRNQIYTYVLTGPWYPASRREIYLSDRPNDLCHPLTRTCRTLRSETLGMYFALNSFVIRVGEPRPHYIYRTDTQAAAWLEAIGPEMCAVLQNLSVFSQGQDQSGLPQCQTLNICSRAGLEDEVAALDMLHPQASTAVEQRYGLDGYPELWQIVTAYLDMGLELRRMKNYCGVVMVSRKDEGQHCEAETKTTLAVRRK